MRTYFNLTVILSAALLAIASEANAAEYTIKMVSHADKAAYAFEPNKLTIKSGDTVTWINAQDDTHNVMSESTPKGAKPFESPMLEKQGQSWSYVFTQSGTYSFHCHPHADAGMRGEIIVDTPSPSGEQASSHSHEHSEHAGMDTGEKPSPLTAEQATQLLHDSKPVYSCGMKPTWFSDKPGQCPCCTMELEKVKSINDGKALFDPASNSTPMMEMKK